MTGIFYRVSLDDIRRNEIITCQEGTLTARSAMLHMIRYLEEQEHIEAGQRVEVFGPYSLDDQPVVFDLTAQDLQDADNL